MPENLERILQRCFHPKEGRPGCQKVSVNTGHAGQHIDKAHGNLRAMQVMFENDLFDWTIICGYYAMYHAVLASLYKIGICATTHYCAIAAFNEFYVKRGRVKKEFVEYIKRAKQLEQKYSESLNKAQGNRVAEQYGVEIITNDDAEWIIEDAKDFVLAIEEILAS